MTRRMAIWVVLLGLLAACGGSDGGGDGLGGGGGTGNKKQAFDFDPCDDVFTHEELEALVGHALEAPTRDWENSCNWASTDFDDGSLSVMLYPRMDDSAYQNNRRHFETWESFRDLNGLGDKAFFAYRTMFGMISQGAMLSIHKGVGISVDLTGKSVTEQDSERVLRKAVEKYVDKL